MTRRAFSIPIRRSYGIILVTGPTGSGKTTTLYAALQAVKKNVNIITVEDPIEYELARRGRSNCCHRSISAFRRRCGTSCGTTPM